MATFEKYQGQDSLSILKVLVVVLNLLFMLYLGHQVFQTFVPSVT